MGKLLRAESCEGLHKSNQRLDNLPPTRSAYSRQKFAGFMMQLTLDNFSLTRLAHLPGENFVDEGLIRQAFFLRGFAQPSQNLGV